MAVGRGNCVGARAGVDLRAQMPTPLTFGRYAVLGTLGEGRLGAALLAYDPELERRVCIKQLAPREGGDSAGLLKQAQAMARVSHPNIVAVYDAGTVDGRVYLAMEYVDGGTLEAWLAERPRTFRQVVAVFADAARGVAAAHAAKLLHGDLEPRNILIGSDGRARVSDFGLGAVSSLREPDPRYAAPEVTSGGGASASADQYSLAACLHEALFGAPPLDGRLLGAAPRTIADRRAPRAVRALLERALAPDPARRFPSVDALAAELAKDPHARRRALFAALGTLAVALSLGAGGRWLTERDRQACRGPDASFEDVWSTKVQRQLRESASSAPFAREAMALLEPRLTGHAARWTALWVETCEATRVRGEQSQALMRRRLECLAARKEEVRGALGALASPERARWARAVELPVLFFSAERCAELLPPQSSAPDGGTPGNWAPVERELALLRGGAFVAPTVEAERALRDLLARIPPDTGDAADPSARPVRARALLGLERVLRQQGRATEAERAAYDALGAAEAGREDFAAAEAWLRISAGAADRPGGTEQALAVGRHAAAAIERLGGEPSLELTLRMTTLRLRLRARALPEAERELAAATRLLPLVPARELAESALLQLGAELALCQSNPQLAERRLDQARELLVRTAGPRHPLLAELQQRQGLVLAALGRSAEAEVELSAALALATQALGERSEAVGAAALALANGRLLLRTGDAAVAAFAAQQTFAALARPEREAAAAATLALAELRAGRTAKALALATAADAQANGAFPQSLVLGAAAGAAGDAARAKTALERALALAERGGLTEEIAEVKRGLAGPSSAPIPGIFPARLEELLEPHPFR